MKTIHLILFATLSFVVLAAPLPAATPDWVNYQGVLRDATGAPRNGNIDMTFRFFDAPTGGAEILVDRHLASGTGAVFVSGGLFSVPLGSGAVSDGAAVLPGDPYTTLRAMFREFPDVWMQVEIAMGGPTEVLVPRVQMQAVPFAHQAANADEAFQAEEAVHAANADNAASATFATNAGSAGFAANAGSASTAVTATTATNATQLGGVAASGYLNTSSTSQTKAGALTVGSIFVAGGNNIQFGSPGATIAAPSIGMFLTGGDQATDDMSLRAGPGPGNGTLLIEGLDTMWLRSGNGNFDFSNDATSAHLATLDPTGTFNAAGDLVASGNHLRFGFAGAEILASSSALAVTAGDADTDDLSLRAGNDLSDGAILMQGDSDFLLYSGSGIFRFIDGSASLVTATFQPGGDVSFAGVVATLGNSYLFGEAGARISATASFMELQAGDLNTDDLLLRAGNDSSDGSVDIIGDGQINLRAGSGVFNFLNGETGTTVATLTPAGLFTASDDLVALGNEVHLGTPGSVRFVRNPVNDDVYIARDEDQNNTASTFSIFTNIGIQQMRINDGDEAPAFFDGAVNVNGIDYAEAFWITDPSLVAGEVVTFDPERPGYIARAREAYSNRVAGVISTNPGFVTGGSFDAEEAADPALAAEMKRAYAAKDYDTSKDISLALEQKKQDRQRPVALMGRLPVQVDASYGPIAAGDHLTSSPTPGHAMKMTEAGPSIGVALEGFAGPGTGTILAFVQRGHYTPESLLAETREAQARLADTVSARTPDPATGVQVMPTNLQVVLDATGDQEARFSVFRDGEASAPRAEVFRVDERGNVWSHGAFRPRSMDVAETFRVSEPVEPGDVLTVDRDHPGRYARTRMAGDTAVVGVVASDPGVLLGGDVSRVLGESPDLAESLATARASGDQAREQSIWGEMERRFLAAHASVALTGTVPVKVDAAYGAIAPGDLLVASPTPGHAMRAASPAAEGAVIGKALEPLPRGTGTIRMLVMLR